MFNKDERYIRNKYGSKNHFKVPNGYFDALKPRVMQSISSKEVRSGSSVIRVKTVNLSVWRRYRKAVVGIAASACVCLFSLSVFFHNDNVATDSSVAKSQPKVEQSSNYSSIDAIVDYTMMDADDMYAYMADLN